MSIAQPIAAQNPQMRVEQLMLVIFKAVQCLFFAQSSLRLRQKIKPARNQ